MAAAFRQLIESTESLPRVVAENLERRLTKAVEPEERRCEEDPLYWLNTYGWMVDPKSEKEEERVFRLQLWPEQRGGREERKRWTARIEEITRADVQ